MTEFVLQHFLQLRPSDDGWYQLARADCGVGRLLDVRRTPADRTASAASSRQRRQHMFGDLVWGLRDRADDPVFVGLERLQREHL